MLVGCGSIGLPFAVALAKTGYAVEAFDVDKVRLKALATGTEILREAALSEALAETVAAGTLRFVEAIGRSPEPRCFVLAVPTPWSADGGFDDSFLTTAVDMIGTVMTDGDALLIRSTTPVGTTRALAARLSATGLEVDVAAIPDRTVEGKSFSEEFLVPHLAGGVTQKATARAVALLERLGTAVALNDAESAEAAKLFSNATRHVLFSLSNEMALICERLGLDIHHVLEAGGHRYDRFRAPRPGPVGGPCLGKDIGMLTGLIAPEEAPIFNAAKTVNAAILDRIEREAGERFPTGPARIAIIGVAFKGRPAVDDARGSFAVDIAGRLRTAYPNAVFSAWDPVMTAAQIGRLGLTPADGPGDAAKGADIVILANDHPEVAAIDQEEVGQACRKPALVYNITGAALPAGKGFGRNVTVRTFGVGHRCSEESVPLA